jgi:glycosyltransferase involved in cell wall biosynthesis
MSDAQMPELNAPRVLLSAYQCGPGMGSVSQIGWEWYARMAQRVPVTLLTHVRNRDALESHGAPVPGSEILYIDTEWFAGPLYRLASRLFPRSQHAVFMLSSLDFYVFDHSALRQVKRRLRAASGRPWDLLHSATPVSPVATSVLHRCGLPTLLGPLNGGLQSPTTFPEFMKQDAAWLYPLRNLGRLMDALAGTTRHARRILVATEATLAWYPPRYRDKCVPVLENAVDLDLFKPTPWPVPPSATQPLSVLFVGRLVPFKAIPLLLRAMQQLQDRFAIQLTIIGDGPMRGPWTQEARELGLADTVTFAGPKPLAVVHRFMADAHVFCLPSVRESGGAVLLEAMASARPVIAVDYGGPAEIVDDAVGRKVPATGNAAAIAGIRDALIDVVEHPDAWRQRGETGRQRVETRYSWPAKIDAAVALYRDLVNGA